MTMKSFVLKNAMIVDGTGGPLTRGDVVVRDGKIASASSELATGGEYDVIDVSGLAVAPGFIDVHSHADNAPFLESPDLSKVSQGVTTEVVGNCGHSLAPRTARDAKAAQRQRGEILPPVDWSGESFAALLAAADERGYVVNYAPLLGHGTLRIAAMGFDSRRASDDEFRSMERMLEEALDAGVIGLSSGLIYTPACFAPAEELVRLARMVERRGGLYTTHIRSESGDRLAAISEAIGVARETGVRVEISHHKAMGRPQWGGVRASLQLVEDARADGLDVRFDVYPYTASSTTLTACLPPELSGLAAERLLEALSEHGVTDRIRQAIARDDWNNHVMDAGGYDGIRIATTGDHRFEGQSLEQIGEDLHTDGADALVTVLREEQLNAGMLCFAMCEADVADALSDRLTTIGSDGLPPGQAGKPHPRTWGTFPRVLARYVREAAVLPLEEAIRRMTGLAAETFNLNGIGLLKPGYAADIVVFDPGAIEDTATYNEPERPAAGVKEVFIAGTSVYRDGRYTGARVGRRLTRG